MWSSRQRSSVAAPFTLLLSLVLFAHFSLAIFLPWDTEPNKVKQKIDLKPDTASPPTSIRPPVRVYSRPRTWRTYASLARRRVWGVESPRGSTNKGRGAGRGEARNAPTETGRIHTPTHNIYTPTQNVHAPQGSTHTLIGNTQVPSEAPLCPAPHGLFPYPQDCSKYVHCTWGKGVVRPCGPGTVFNPAISTCDWPHRVTCSSTTPPPTPSPERAPGPQGIPPGHGNSQGRWKNPPGHGRSPGHRTSWGRNANRGGQVESTERRDSSPGHRGSPPGHSGSPAGQLTPPGQSGSSPGQSGSSPGQSGSPPSKGVGPIASLFGEADAAYKGAKTKAKKLLKKAGLSDTSGLCLRPNGVFPYPKNCKKFVNCWRGRPTLQWCAPGTLFHAARGICDFPHKTVCSRTKKSVPSPTSVSFVVPPPSGQKIRLRGSDVPWAGYVQVIDVQGKWSLVADEEGGWTQEEASVVCRNLGFTRGAETASQGAVFGLLPGQIAAVRALECQGYEEHLTECQLTPGSRDDLERTVVGVQCVRNWMSECEKGGMRWGDKCYYVNNSSPLITHLEARDACTSKGTRLLSITSQAENDFVSDMLSSMAGDTVGFHIGAVRSKTFGQVTWLWHNTSSPASTLPFSRWWPGWNVTEGRQGEAGRVAEVDGEELEGYKCVVLKDTFPVSPGEEGDAPAEYFFWQLTACNEKLHFVCESDKLDVGCVVERGVNYTGTARVTGKGEACLAWDHPTLLQRVRGLQPHSPLVENYCANPDGDDLPWCFTSQGTASACDIPRCERQTAVEEECGADKFRCSSGGCVNGVWHCDGHQDCEDGSDEVGCRDYSDSFSKALNQRLTGREVEKWMNTLKTTCATRCVQAKNFVCMSFNYQQSSETCVLSESVVGRSGGLVEQPGWEYYEMDTFAVDCTGSFVCSDGMCLNSSRQCDGRRDCKGGEDEEGCEDEVNFDVRLVNGSSPNEGRVEVRAHGQWGAVCDDMWGMLEGDVVCQSLGFPLGAREVFRSSHFGSGDLQYLMDDLNCRGTEETLAKCDFAGWGEHDCVDSEEVAGVRCFTEGDECGREEWPCKDGKCVKVTYLCDTVDDCRDGSDEDRAMCESPLEVRLVGNEEPSRGTSDNRLGEEDERGEFAGRVEVRYLGMWGSVCDDDFNIEEGNVLCRMMGWDRATHIYKNNTYGPGSGFIWLDDLRCLGFENSVENCLHMPWGVSNCDHTEDVGLRCTSDSDTSTGSPSEAAISSEGASPRTPPAAILPAMCGRRLVEDNPTAPILERPKIVSGHTPQPGSHPWMVAIYLRTKTGPKQSCGAAVLSEDIVLTAAHCVNKYPPSTYILRIGDYNIEEEEEGQQEFRVSSIAMHPQFDKGPYLNNDVAVLRVQRKNGKGIQFGRNVQPLCLVPSSWTYPAFLNCTVAGWGSLGISLGYSKVLQSALLPILPKTTCQADHVYGPVRLTSGMYCAGYLEGGVDTCQGDSGGPMVCLIGGRHTVVGITSWGHGCARPNKPGVYTKLTHYLPWLTSNLG